MRPPAYLRPSKLLVLLLALTAGAAHAQPFHLPPVYRTPLQESTVLLTLTRATPAPRDSAGLQEAELLRNATLIRDASRAPGAAEAPVPEQTTVFVSRGRVVINVPGQEPFVVEARELTIGQVCALVREHYQGALDVTAGNPLLPARLLADSQPGALSGPVRLVANPGDPTVGLGFGAQFALNDTPGDSDGLLGGTGFNLDLVGTHRLMRGRVSNAAGAEAARSWWIPYAFVQGRLGLNANQQLAVGKDGDASPDAAPSEPPDGQGQLEDAIRQADQAVLTGQLDLVWPLFAETEFSLSFNGGVSWTKLDALDLPLIPVPASDARESLDTLVSAETVFPAPLVERVSNQLREVRPLADFGATALLRFNAADAVAFYAGGGLGRKEIFQRGIRFTRGDDDQPDPTSLTAELHTPAASFWRLVFGARIEGIAEVRADAVGALDRNRFPSLLRFIISKTFPIAR